MTLHKDINCDMFQEISYRVARRVWKLIVELNYYTLPAALCTFRRHWRFIGDSFAPACGTMHEQFEVMVHNIHDRNLGKYLVFPRSITFDAFRDEIVGFGDFSAEEAEHVQMASRDHMDYALKEMNDRSFKKMVSAFSIHFV